ncbi:MAG: hypothetical protein ACQCN4_08100 [Candidatus Bathyarchaeia archaeon]|jgi:hypothetical protein
MPILDLAMPLALFIVISVALILNKRVENKLIATVEQKEFKTRDILLLGVFIVIMVTVVALTSMYNPGGLVPNVLLIMFLASYTMLLFTFSYVFTNLTRQRAQLVSGIFGSASLIMGVISLLAPFADVYAVYRAAAFFLLTALCFVVVVYEARKTITKSRWYVAAQPPALFLLMFLLFAAFYDGAVNVWFPYLMDAFAFTFALLIILYLSSLFTWKTALVFAAFLPIIDVILVFTGPMVAAAQTFTGLGLPVLVFLPKIPLYYNAQGNIQFGGLGLGDYFFAGILVIQTLKKWNMKTAIFAAAAIAVSFGIWEAFLLDIDAYLSNLIGHKIGGFPATVCIITGWLPVIGYKLLTAKKRPIPPPLPETSLPEITKEPSLPPQ